METVAVTAYNFLDKVRHGLGYQDGILLNAVQIPLPDSEEAGRWVDVGDWLVTANKVKADKVFFVKNDPLIVFSSYEHALSDDDILDIFRRVWCMARPQRLFLSFPGQLRVYDLQEAPFNAQGNPVKPLISTTHDIAEALELLKNYRREQLEAGYLPENERLFGKPSERADRRLIQDLGELRKALTKAGLESKHAHALIGRSIFIRYLEDRSVLTDLYFQRIAEKKPEWKELLKQDLEKPEIKAVIRKSELHKRRYCNVLPDKDFTYALFDRLAEDFNGDLFPKDVTEKDAVTLGHLDLLRKFLLGDVDQKQLHLFFWTYDFEIVPIELISSIYEEFYHDMDNGDDTGTHYTPGVLVEFMLSHLLRQDRLAASPKILDPACGSGIFLVEAFRRIVRYRTKEKGDFLSPLELREILHTQISGIELNPGAIYVSAFSLYLALLHYQKPPDILAQIEFPYEDMKPLPHLIYDENYPDDKNYYHILFNVNTFALMENERILLKKESEANPGKTSIRKFYKTSDNLPINENSYDIIIGNPPWGIVKQKKAAPGILQAQVQTQGWCKQFGWVIGDKELSQAFIARSLTLLKPGGECGFLVSTGVFFKRHPNSQKFRQRWLNESTIKNVVNFAHVREIYFSGAVSPFAFVHYKASQSDYRHRIRYWSAKRIKVVENLQSVVLHYSDLKAVLQSELERNEQLWKVYWWGSHRDADLINILNFDKKLGEIVDKHFWDNGQGYTPGTKNSSTQVVYKITQQTYQQLRKEKIPLDILNSLKPLRKDKNRNEKDFSQVLKKILDEESAEKYSSAIMRYSQNFLNNYKELSIRDNFRRYGTVTTDNLEKVPDKVHRHGNFGVYQGCRLIIKRGITQENEANGRIDSRLEDISYCFRNSAHGINVNEATEWERKTLIGILWSSLARYYYFMTAGSWVTWHCEIQFAPLMNLPIRFAEDPEIRQRIIQIVNELQNWNPDQDTLLHPEGKTNADILNRLTLLERELDDAIFDLYELSEPERDLILDMCETGLEFFYRNSQSQAVQPIHISPSRLQGTTQDLPQERHLEKGLDGYLYAFLDMWNDELEPDGEFRWQVIHPPYNPMLAVVFRTQYKGKPLPQLSHPDTEWNHVLQRIHKTSEQEISRNIYLDGIVRKISDTEIFIIKRNERRLWTRSMAREDAEATLSQAVQLQKTYRDGR
ncbi:MAG: N-6 DNA methylase [Desulfococcaceae bacterium]|jgi:type I restriction-modification system DNA methylase subunit|nr:N-6 DNA methylase [Desulfococcaceae bacterium]